VLFNSYAFILGFLPVVLLLHYVLGRRLGLEGALVVLGGASLAFYGYWNPAYLVLIVGSIVANYGLGHALSRIGADRPHARKQLVALGIVLNLGLLGYYKYANFFVDTWNALGGPPLFLAKIALPLAISFFTFQQISYLLSAYQNPEQRVSWWRYGFCVTFFPHLLAGPIILYKELLPQLEQKIIRFDPTSWSVGLSMFAFGLAKKVLLADNIARFSSPVFDALPSGAQPTPAAAWLAVFAYSLQLYFDFSGYSDMAVGLARLFNLKMPANFDSPYKAKNVGEFWRRWHMTLSRFLREYLYIPLGGNRGSTTRVACNLMITMVLGGLWHGAGWGFVLWGAVNGVFLVTYFVYSTWRKKQLAGRPAVTSRLGREISITVTFALVMLSRVSFRAPDWNSSVLMYRSLVGDVVHGVTPFSLTLGGALCVAGYAVCRVCPNTQEIMAAYEPVIERVRGGVVAFRPNLTWAAVVGAVLLACFLSLGHVSEFLYFQF